MNITLDENTLSQAIQTAASSAVLKGLSSWDLQESVAQSAKAAIEEADLPRIVRTQLDQILAEELEPLVSEAIKDAMPALRQVITESIRSMSAAMLYGLARGRPSPYSVEDSKTWDECMERAGAKKDENSGLVPPPVSY